jgi:hypothetical protein
VTEHLSERQILAWQLKEQTPEEQRHVEHCRRCQGQVTALDRALSLYRSSVHGWSAAPHREPGRAIWTTPSRWQLWRGTAIKWASAAALTLAVAVPVYTHRVIEERNAARALADQALLDQVDQEVSQTVPDTMEPLTQLVEWQPADTEVPASSNKTRRTK